VRKLARLFFVDTEQLFTVMKNLFTEIDFGVGQPHKTDNILDLDRGVEDQKENLLQDILQVAYPDGYILDVGWYPKCQKVTTDSFFAVYVIKDSCWDAPIFLNRSKDIPTLKIHIENAVKFIFDLL